MVRKVIGSTSRTLSSLRYDSTLLGGEEREQLFGWTDFLGPFVKPAPRRVRAAQAPGTTVKLPNWLERLTYRPMAALQP